MQHAESSPSSNRRSPRDGAAAPRGGRRRFLEAAVTLPLLGLVACKVPVPGQGPPPDLYRLTPKSTFDPSLPTVGWQLVLETPLANAGIDTVRIGLQRTPTLFEYYAKANWSDRAPQRVQTLMIESFENSHRIVAVGRDSVALRADFVLKSELREFQAEYFDSAIPQVHIGMTVRLVQMPRRAIIGSKAFEARVPAQADRMADIVDAFDEALGKVLRHIVEWTLTTGEAAYKKP